MGLSLLFMLAGFILLSKGWRETHGGHGALITDGSYAYTRHPSAIYRPFSSDHWFFNPMANIINGIDDAGLGVRLYRFGA